MCDKHGYNMLFCLGSCVGTNVYTLYMYTCSHTTRGCGISCHLGNHCQTSCETYDCKNGLVQDKIQASGLSLKLYTVKTDMRVNKSQIFL